MSCVHLLRDPKVLPSMGIVDVEGIKCWDRGEKETPRYVQFCTKGMRRINSIHDCCESGFKSCYVNHEEPAQ